MRRLVRGVLMLGLVAMPGAAFGHPGHGNAVESRWVSPAHYLLNSEHWNSVFWVLAIGCVLGTLAWKSLRFGRRVT